MGLKNSTEGFRCVNAEIYPELKEYKADEKYYKFIGA